MKKLAGRESRRKLKKDKLDGSIFHKPYLLLALSTFPALF